MPVLVSMQPNGSIQFLRKENPATGKPESTIVIQNGRATFTVGTRTAVAYIGNDHVHGLKEIAGNKERVLHPEIKGFLQEVASLLDPEGVKNTNPI